MSINKAIIIGHVGQDPKIRTLQDGKRFASFSVATSESWKDKATGEKKERTEWHNISIATDGLVNVVETYVRKGMKVYVEGKIQTRKWTDQSGVEKYTTEIVLSSFDSKLEMLSKVDTQATPHEQAKADGYQPKTMAEELNDDVPF
jgi:single-strand DNA-binding protein